MIALLGLVTAQFMALPELWNEDGLTQKEQIERVTVEQATIANTSVKMEHDKFIERRIHTDDGPTHLIYLTEKAKQLEAEATNSAMIINRTFCDHFQLTRGKRLLNSCNATPPMLRRQIISKSN